MKIAFLNAYQGVVERGAETFVFELSKRLSKKHKVEIYSSNKIPSKRWPLLWRLFLDPNGLFIFWFTLEHLPEIWRQKYDVVIPINGGWQPALIRLVSWLYGGKMVISGQSGKGWDDRNNLFNFPDTFVGLSTKLTKWAKRVNPLIRVEYIPNGVDINKFRREGKKVSFNLEKPIILCAGALTNEKRMDLVIRAVSKLGKGSLVVAGDGPLKRDLLKLGKNLLGERFLLKKYDFEKMPEVYRGVDLFTLPSPWYRAFETVLVEAMATGLPVVANDDEIRKEIVGEAGLLVDPVDTVKYAQALKKALTTDWGDKPKNQARKFDWDKIVDKYEKLFENLVSR